MEENLISVITPSIRPEGLKLVEKALKRQTHTDYEWLVDTSGEKNEGDYWGVYKAYNRLIKKAKGKLIVSWQDWTSADPTALEKFWFHHETEPKTIVGAVGNKYTNDTFTAITWKDPRELDTGAYITCPWMSIELNLASFPTEAFYAVGGFDEYLDKYSSLCGIDVLDRLNNLGGYEFKLDQTIKSYSLEHGRLPLWEENSPFNGPYNERRKVYKEKLSYL